MSHVTRLLQGGLILLGLLLCARSASAQADIRLASLFIDLWPEFDKSSVLVILDGALQPEVPLPATVTLRIPARAGAPNAVAVRDSSGQLLTAPYTSARQGEELLVTLTSDSREFRLEYYDPVLTVEGSARRYEFRWTSDYAVDSVVLRVQQPSGAEGLVADPAVTPSGVADYGLNYYGQSLGALAAGQTLTLDLSYTKASAQLSVEALGLSAASTADASVVATPSPTLSWPIALAAAGGVLLAGGGAYYWFSARRRMLTAKPKTHQARARARSRAAPPPAAGRAVRPASPASFCTQCGHALHSGDRFCRSCGAPVKVSS
jgi:hypothetical protein